MLLVDPGVTWDSPPTSPCLVSLEPRRTQDSEQGESPPAVPEEACWVLGGQFQAVVEKPVLVALCLCRASRTLQHRLLCPSVSWGATHSSRSFPSGRGPLAPGQLSTCAVHLELWSCNLCLDAVWVKMEGGRDGTSNHSFAYQAVGQPQ